MELSVFTPLHATAVWGELTLMRNNNAPRDTLTPYIVDNTFPIYPRRSITGMAEDSSTSLAPCKRINDGDDLNFFLASTAYRDIKIWLLQLNRALFPTKDAHGNISICTLDSPPTYSPVVTSLRSLVTDLENLLTQAPPDTGPRRFGNVAFREWYRLAEERMDSLLEKHIGSILEQHASDPAVLAELKAYLLGSFGSAQRLDYGTGHELSFLAFLACLSKIDAFAPGEERAIVIGVVQP
jgi:serine/threonine-protein phosphatase 2A activator